MKTRRQSCGNSQFSPNWSRRELLSRAGGGFGLLALNSLLYTEAMGQTSQPSRSKPPTGPVPAPFQPKAKNIIWLFMEGGPSGFDLFDRKPELEKRHGERLSGIQAHFGTPGPLLKSPFEFKQYGQSGGWVSHPYARLGEHIDDIAQIKSCFTESENHAPAMYQMNTGYVRPGFPSAGSWLGYGLGSENDSLPGFVVLPPGVNKGGPQNWGAGFLPSQYQGTVLRVQGQPMLNLKTPPDINSHRQGRLLEFAGELNRLHANARNHHPELEARIKAYELAYRMQMEAPEAVDIDSEPDYIKSLYGLDKEGDTRSFGRKCLLARRMIERGVRFVQVYSNDEWDAHGDIKSNHLERCAESEIPIAGLLTDLKQRGMMEDTLVIWGGEFGRLPVSQGGKGRDHNPHGFMMWMAGAGIKGGASVGNTDKFGFKAEERPVPTCDIHATILHLMGLDHEELTYLHQGREFRLTDVAGDILYPILS